jgi:D-serine deaminase-like pyridoxal phosphate-dependent protein
MMKDWYIIDNVDEIDTPALVVYPDRVKENISLAKNIIEDVERLRPHVKTHKNGEVTRLMLETGITKFKCATIAEAEMLAINNAPDVLLAYQPSGPKLERLMQLIRTYPATHFSCLIDNVSSAEHISKVAARNELIIDVFIDLNIGMNRTGIYPEDAVELYMVCAALPGINVKGLHAYDGHVHEADLHKRIKHCDKCYEAVAKLQRRLRKKGYEPMIIAGGSPTFPIHAPREEIEVSPGTFIYWDRGYQLKCHDQPFLTAALVVARVISLPTPTTICIDCGHKSIASENELSKRVYFLNAPELKVIGHSEEHLIADAGEKHHYKAGDILYGLPYHICPTVALYERVITIKNGKANGEWKNIARDRKITL